MLEYQKIATDINSMVRALISKGKIKEAHTLHRIAQTIEALQQYPLEIAQKAQELGEVLTPDKVAEIIARYSNPSMSETMIDKKAFDMGSKVKQLALLAAMLGNFFISNVEAGGEPITVKTPWGTQTYTAKDLKREQKLNPETFAIIMKMYNEQQGAMGGLQEKRVLHEQEIAGKPKPGQEMKTVKNVEELKDEFGNTARLITYGDDTKKLEGDILHGGVSLREKLLKRGEILPE